MRHILFPLLLLLFVISFCLFSALYVANTIDQTELCLDTAIGAYKAHNQDLTEHYLAMASSVWNGRQLFLGIIMEHEDVDEISSSFARLQSYAHTEDHDDFLSNCAALGTTLSHIREMEWPYLQNIL